MRYYFVDYENVLTDGLVGISKLDSTDKVCILYSKNA